MDRDSRGRSLAKDAAYRLVSIAFLWGSVSSARQSLDPTFCSVSDSAVLRTISPDTMGPSLMVGGRLEDGN
ncbi:MAG TPA: hypothetical protein VEH01_01200 [Nitrososphaerales archaeon]|nr:hypothetical protein [Nitrososphaerales archaeon]